MAELKVVLTVGSMVELKVDPKAAWMVSSTAASTADQTELM